MKFPLVTHSLAERLELAEIRFVTSRIQGIRERAGNPMGAEIARFGGATAYYVRQMPWPLFNTVKGLGPDDLDELDPLLAFYKERGRICTFELIPGKTNAAVTRALAERGYFQEGFHSCLYGLPEPTAPVLPPYLRIEPVTGRGQFELYGALHCAGTGMDPGGTQHFIDNNIVLFDRPGWRFFLGYIDGQPAGVGVMHIDGEVASCTLAATLPEFRGRGLQTAMLQTRMHEAAKAGCRIVAAQADFGSASQNNMERLGMRLAYTRATWGQLAARGSSSR
ncbi:GNAT family N-acetyltransferase [Paenibacillus lutrae]|uniref:GNAT family N-acetyltransferase n=1 Tax=Paenibacillus lutrae TaxID=2078573 RepID=A0A7X3FF07_9BACL|nr:GNAT family N-acetyltransferase [Paenibacillus lutrae]MVO98500.1 GNAT family N-acetyltransferase [Paenibacillus lutrae]